MKASHFRFATETKMELQIKLKNPTRLTAAGRVFNPNPTASWAESLSGSALFFKAGEWRGGRWGGKEGND